MIQVYETNLSLINKESVFESTRFYVETQVLRQLRPKGG